MIIVAFVNDDISLSLSLSIANKQRIDLET